MNKIKAVIFDLGGVLVVSTTSEDVATYKREARPQQEVVDLAIELKKKGYKIAILSNTISEHTSILERFKIFSQFDEIIFSYEVGLRKPDQQIYKLALERLDVLPSETIFIDDKKEYVDAASSLGIKGIRFTTIENLKNDLASFVS